MKSLLMTALLLTAAAASAQLARDLEPFDALAVNAGIEAEIKRGDRHRIELTGDAEALDALEIDNEGGSLGLGFEDGAYRRLSGQQRGSVRAVVYTPSLERVVVNGGATVGSEVTWASDDFRVVANGGSELTLALDIDGEVKLVVNGGSDVRLSGAAERLKLNVNGGSEVNASALMSQRADVMANGSSQAMVHADAGLKVMANGNSDVQYTGNVTSADVRTNGGSSVSRG